MRVGEGVGCDFRRVGVVPVEEIPLGVLDGAGTVVFEDGADGQDLRAAGREDVFGEALVEVLRGTAGLRASFLGLTGGDGLF